MFGGYKYLYLFNEKLGRSTDHNSSIKTCTEHVNKKLKRKLIKVETILARQPRQVLLKVNFLTKQTIGRETLLLLLIIIIIITTICNWRRNTTMPLQGRLTVN